jgi:hypothetical protein
MMEQENTGVQGSNQSFISEIEKLTIEHKREGGLLTMVVSFILLVQCIS